MSGSMSGCLDELSGYIIWWVDQWVDVWMNWVDLNFDELINEWIFEWIDDCFNEINSEWINGWIDELEWIGNNKLMSEFINGLMSGFF